MEKSLNAWTAYNTADSNLTECSHQVLKSGFVVVVVVVVVHWAHSASCVNDKVVQTFFFLT